MDSSINFIMPCNISNIKFIMYAYLILFIFMRYAYFHSCKTLPMYKRLWYINNLCAFKKRKKKKKKESNKIFKEKRNYSIIKL